MGYCAKRTDKAMNDGGGRFLWGVKEKSKGDERRNVCKGKWACRQNAAKGF